MKNNQWHVWFAWYPVAFGPFIAWLKPIQRKWYESEKCWLYRRNKFPLSDQRPVYVLIISLIRLLGGN